MSRHLALPRFLRLRLGRRHVRQADLHRGRAEWHAAVVGYRQGVAWMPWRDDLTVQIGNCLKEAGDYRAASEAYRSVGVGPSRAEALRQLNDVHQRAGMNRLGFNIAEDSSALPNIVEAIALPPLGSQDFPNRVSLDPPGSRRWLGSLGQTVPLPDPSAELPGIILDQVGALTILRDGQAEPLFAGVIAIRARIRSAEPPGFVEVWLGEGEARQRIALAEMKLAQPGGDRLALHVINLWLASDSLPPGRHWLAIRTTGQALTTGLFVTIVAQDGTLELAASNAYLPAPTRQGGDLVAAVVARPTKVRSADRSIFDDPIRSILALRVDQLGDVAASLPAIARLRELFPGARLTILVQRAVRAIVEASGVADRVLTIDLPYDSVGESYGLPPAEERRLASLLAADKFDLAIDLCTAPQTRPLLLLTAATYLVGFSPHDFPFLDYGIDVRSRDKANQRDIVPHGAVVSTLVDGLAAAISGRPRPVRRIAPSDAILAAHGLPASGHIVIHTGSRYALNRWPLASFYELAERLLAATPHAMVLFRDDVGDPLPPALANDERVHGFGLVDADAFDAIISTARLFVGNDSGPKHLAALRGVPTVSAHVDRLNWNEWGQTGPGAILSKHVPCTGCGLNDLALCGLDAICVRSIGVEEMLQAALAQL